MEQSDILGLIDKGKFVESLRSQAGEGTLFLELVSAMLDSVKPVIAAALAKAYKESV